MTVVKVKVQERRRAEENSRPKVREQGKVRIRPPQTATQNQKTHPRTTKTATKLNRPTKIPSILGSVVTKTARRRRVEGQSVC
jgi:hypothetical protein